MVKATIWYAHDCGSEPNLSNFLPFDFHVHRNMKLYIPDMYVLYSMYIVWTSMYTNMREHTCMLVSQYVHVCWCHSMYMSKHGMYWNNVFSNVYTCLFMVYTLHIQMIYLSAHGSSWFIPWTWNIIVWYNYFLEVCNSVLVCTALVTWMYYAIVQKLAVWYRQGSERDIPFEVWLCQVSAFL